MIIDREKIMSVGFNKDGEADFSVSALIYDLDYESMKDFRSMIVVAIGTAEQMWRKHNEEKNITNANR